MGLHLFYRSGFMPPVHTDCKDASHLGFNPEKNLSISKTLKMLGTPPNFISLKTELILSVLLWFFFYYGKAWLKKCVSVLLWRDWVLWSFWPFQGVSYLASNLLSHLYKSYKFNLIEPTRPTNDSLPQSVTFISILERVSSLPSHWPQATFMQACTSCVYSQKSWEMNLSKTSYTLISCWSVPCFFYLGTGMNLKTRGNHEMQ